MEQIILPKNIFLPHFEIVQNFHYFVILCQNSIFRAPVDFLMSGTKNSIFQKLPVDFPQINFPKTGSNVIEMFLLMIGTNSFAKNISLPHFEIVQNFHYFVRSRLSIFCQKFNFPKTASNVVEMFLLMSGKIQFCQKIFSYPILR